MNLKDLKLSDFNLDNLNPKEKKTVIALLVIEIILILCIFAIVCTMVFSKIAPMFSSKQVEPLFTTSPADVNPEPTPTPTFTPQPTATEIVLSEVWIVTSIEENATMPDGRLSDLATFSNSNYPGATIKAFCIDPGWPSPVIGQRYVEGADNLLIPEENNSNNTIQRFQIP